MAILETYLDIQNPLKIISLEHDGIEYTNFSHPKKGVSYDDKIFSDNATEGIPFSSF